jgi:hypothetical protein
MALVLEGAIADFAESVETDYSRSNYAVPSCDDEVLRSRPIGDLN